jgi:hypothetical protein
VSQHDLGALSSALEVKRPSEPEPKPAASAGQGPETPAKGGDQDGDRKALNRASEALKKVNKLESLLATANEQNQQLVATILQNQGAPANGPGKTQKPPYSEADITAMFVNQEFDKATLALAENNKWQRDIDRAEIEQATEQKIQQKTEGTALNAFLVKELGVGDPDSDYVQTIEIEARKLMQKFPSLAKDPATAQVIAGMHVYKKAALGDIEFEDLRQESTERTDQPDGTRQPTGIEPKVEVDWISDSLTFWRRVKIHTRKRFGGTSSRMSSNMRRR